VGQALLAGATTSPITKKDVELATELAIADLDASFFRVRFDRLAPSEKRYLRAMAELGPGPHRSGDIAEQLGTKVQSVAPIRGDADQQGHGLQPCAWRHRLHGARSSTIHATRDAVA